MALSKFEEQQLRDSLDRIADLEYILEAQETTLQAHAGILDKKEFKEEVNAEKAALELEALRLKNETAKMEFEDKKQCREDQKEVDKWTPRIILTVLGVCVFTAITGAIVKNS